MDWVVGGNVLGQAINRRFALDFRRKSSEQLVPEDQNAGMIAVQIPDIGRMVHPMVRWCIENLFKPGRQPVNQLGMQPELVKQVYGHHDKDHDGVKPK